MRLLVTNARIDAGTEIALLCVAGASVYRERVSISPQVTIESIARGLSCYRRIDRRSRLTTEAACPGADIACCRPRYFALPTSAVPATTARNQTPCYRILAKASTFTRKSVSANCGTVTIALLGEGGPK